jgi:hypothetical protein
LVVQLVVLALLLACLSQSPLHMEQHEMRELGSDYSIDVKYPQIRDAPAFNRAVKTAVGSLAADLKRDSMPTAESEKFRNSLQGNYQAEVLKNGIVSVLLDYSQDASTAVHPWGVMAVVNFDNKKCRVLKFGDLFRSGADYVQRISDLAIGSLMQNEYAEATAVEHGAGPNENNFKYFTLTDTTWFCIFRCTRWPLAPLENRRSRFHLPTSDPS